MLRPFRPARSPLPAVVVGVVGLLVIGLGQAIPNRHSIENDLTGRSVQALRAAGVTGAEVHFVGRDGVVRVVSAADVDIAGRVVRAQQGVRVAAVLGPAHLTLPVPVLLPSPVVAVAPAVSFVVDGGVVLLTGAVPSQAIRAALVKPQHKAFGADNVYDQLTVDPSVDDKGLSGLGRIPAVLGTDAVDATMALRDNRIVLTGAVTSVTKKQSAVAAAQRALGATGIVVDELVVAVAPAPESTAPTTTQVQQKLRKLPPITFRTGSATLTKAGRAAVAQAAKLLIASPQVMVRIEGHTDNTGPAKKNLELSRARARAVRHALHVGGVANDRMTSGGFGETRPKVKGTGAAQQAINRRVEFIVR